MEKMVNGKVVQLSTEEETARLAEEAAWVPPQPAPDLDAELQAAVRSIPASGSATPDERIDALIGALTPANGAKIRGRK